MAGSQQEAPSLYHKFKAGLLQQAPPAPLIFSCPKARLELYWQKFVVAATNQFDPVNVRHFANLLMGAMSDLAKAKDQAATVGNVAILCAPYLAKHELLTQLTPAQRKIFADNMDALMAACTVLYPVEDRVAATIMNLGLCLAQWYGVTQVGTAVNALSGGFGNGLPNAPWFTLPGFLKLYAKFVDEPKGEIAKLSRKRRGSNICQANVDKENNALQTTMSFLKVCTEFKGALDLVSAYARSDAAKLYPTYADGLNDKFNSLLSDFTSENLHEYLEALLDRIYENCNAVERKEFLSKLFESYLPEMEHLKSMTQEKVELGRTQPLYNGMRRAQRYGESMDPSLDMNAIHRQAYYAYFQALNAAKGSQSYSDMLLFRYFHADASQKFYFRRAISTPRLSFLGVKESTTTLIRALRGGQSQTPAYSHIAGAVVDTLYGDSDPLEFEASPSKRSPSAVFVDGLIADFSSIFEQIDDGTKASEKRVSDICNDKGIAGTKGGWVDIAL